MLFRSSRRPSSSTITKRKRSSTPSSRAKSIADRRSDSGTEDGKPASVTKKAIVTLVVGPAYAERFERLCRKNWAAYAERHGYDVIVIRDPLDASARAANRSPAWQKCLILGIPEVFAYDRVVWVDSDIYLNPAAPSIVEGVPLERIGVTDEHAYPSPERRQAILKGIHASAPEEGELNKRFWQACFDPGAWHAYMGLPTGQAHIVQTGVMVMSPR